LTLAELNAADATRFADILGGIFEHSPWVAERAAHAGPFVSLDALHAALVRAVQEGSRAEQLALLRAHPDLGSRSRMSRPSTEEQAGAGLAALAGAAHAHLIELNARYREHFGFPFLYAVKGSTPEDIIAALEVRLTRTSEDEFHEALRQVFRIARFRLEAMFNE
jgi:OHCU decarboxylase